jgi:hypothetical protein
MCSSIVQEKYRIAIKLLSWWFNKWNTNQSPALFAVNFSHSDKSQEVTQCIDYFLYEKLLETQWLKRTYIYSSQFLCLNIPGTAQLDLLLGSHKIRMKLLVRLLCMWRPGQIIVYFQGKSDFCQILFIIGKCKALLPSICLLEVALKPWRQPLRFLSCELRHHDCPAHRGWKESV